MAKPASAALWLALALLTPAAARGAPAGYKGAEIYRSSSLTLDKLLSKSGKLIDTYVEARMVGGRNKDKAAARLRAQIESDLAGLAPLAYANLSYSEYISSADRTSYIVFDVVDAKDAPARMPFRPAPKGQLPDPGGLLGSWQQYWELGREQLKQGISVADRTGCRYFYCPFGKSTPELEAFERKFVEGAIGHRKALLAVAEGAASPAQRKAALYVLSFSSEADLVVNSMQNALLDPSEEVRAAAMNVLADVALFHKRLFLDASRLIPALDYPSSDDRSKAMALLIALSDNPTYRPYVVSRAGPYLLRLLKLQHPSQHDLAYTLLSVLSQQNHDRRDYDAWEKWVVSVSSESAPAPPPPAK